MQENENQKFLKRLKKVGSTYSAMKWEMERREMEN